MTVVLKHDSRIRLLLRYLLGSVFLLMSSSSFVMAQSKDFQADGWRGLVLDVSTPEDAIRIFGNPSRDQDNQSVRVWRIDNWLAGKEKQKVFRIFKYKREKVKGVGFVELAFLRGKLAVITLDDLPSPDRREAEWVDPDDLERLFSGVFKPHMREVSEKLLPLHDFLSKAPAELEKYDTVYDLLGVTDKCFIVAPVDNDLDAVGGIGLFGSDPSLGSRDRDKKSVRKRIDASGKYPGYVPALKIISRKLAQP